MKLTPKQKKFCEWYIKTGNAAEAARNAGYSPKTAESTGRENLRKPTVSAYIAERMEKQDAKLIADADEVLRFYSSVMRGQEKDQFGLDAALTDRISAAKELMKRYSKADDGKREAIERLDKILEEIGGVI